MYEWHSHILHRTMPEQLSFLKLTDESKRNVLWYFKQKKEITKTKQVTKREIRELTTKVCSKNTVFEVSDIFQTKVYIKVTFSANRLLKYLIKK